MIWNSPVLMSVIDVAMIVVGFSVAALATKFRLRSNLPGRKGHFLIAFGILVLVGFFTIDLATMWVLPNSIGMQGAMDAMTYLHLNRSWFLIPSATLLIAVGFLLSQRALTGALSQVAWSKNRLQNIMDSVEDGVLTVTQEGIIHTVNASTCRIFGYAEQEICGRPFSVLLSQPYRADHDFRFTEYQSGLSKTIDFGLIDLEGTTKDGRIFPMKLAFYDLPEKDVFIAVVRDISEEKNRQLQLEHVQKMESLGRLTGGVAHDFNNLLTTILGSLELLKDHVRTSEARGVVDSATVATLKGADLTQRLLSFSRKQALQPKPVSVNRTLTEMTEIARRTLGADIRIETRLATELWNALVDSSQLSTALLNLAINARDAMEDGGTLRFETFNKVIRDGSQEVKPGEYVVISVSDTGLGMSREVMSRAFEPFYTTKEVGVGSGLGLSMVYGFVKQSHGHTIVESTPGQGTTVFLCLPRTHSHVTPDGAKPEKPELPNGSERILVVEDDMAVRNYTSLVLKDLGYSVVEAEGVSSASKFIDGAERIDLLLTDIELPGGANGVEIAMAFQKRHPDSNVLFMSGYTDDHALLQDQLGSGNQLLAKPFRKESLARKVRAVLNSEQGQENELHY